MRPGIQKVLDYLKVRISSRGYGPGAAIPGRAQLARLVGVSSNTVARATAQLKRAGVLCGVRGQRPFVTMPPEDPSAPAAGVPAAQNSGCDSIAARIRDDIVRGRYKPGVRIPRVKELCGRYGTSHVTLLKALRRLIAQDFLRRQGHGYSVPRVTLPGDRPYIVFAWFGDFPLLPTHDTDTTFIRSLERECLRNAVGLEKLIAMYGPGRRIEVRRQQGRSAVDPAVIDKCMGIVYLASWWGCANPAVLDWLAHCGKPVTIVDWLGDWELPPSLAARPRMQWIRSSAAGKPGYDAGRYLLSLGHRKIAYFSPYGLQWPRKRMEGIAEAYTRAGLSGAVVPFIQQMVLEESEFPRLVRRRGGALQKLAESPPNIPSVYTAAHTRMATASWQVYADATYYALLEPLFEKAIAVKEITAWVGCGDNVAIMAWCFLRSRCVKIPGRISLMGFGNTLEAIQSEMTSYDYDYEATSAASINFLLRPLFAAGVRTLARPEIGGFIIERGSTARVGGGSGQV